MGFLKHLILKVQSMSLPKQLHQRYVFEIGIIMSNYTRSYSSINGFSFSMEEELYKADIRGQYSLWAGKNATEAEYTNFVWKKFFELKESEKSAWQQKHIAINKLAENYAAKYEKIIDQKNKELEYKDKIIKKLQTLIPSQESTHETTSTVRSACPSCGSLTGCYCK